MRPWIVRSGPVRGVTTVMQLTIEREITVGVEQNGQEIEGREILAAITATKGFEAVMRRAYDVMCAALNAAELDWPERG